MSIVTTIIYQDNSKRIIKHSSAFNQVLKGEPTVQKKVENLAYAWGTPYHIKAVDDDKVIVDKRDMRFKP